MTQTPTALVTGVAGQDGMYLARSLRADGWQVIGTIRPGSPSIGRMTPYLEGVEVIEHELTDGEAFAALLDRHAPDEVYNMAGFSSVGRSWADPELVTRTNTGAVAQMLETLVRHRDRTGHDIRLFQASSAEIFGGDVEGPLDEDTPHRPRTPYAITKSAAHNLVISYREKYGLFACNGVLFNHESPFRGQQFVAGKIARAAAEVAAGGSAEVSLGDIDIERDWGAAADYVDLMIRSLRHERADDYVVATGASYTLRQMLVAAFGSVGIDDAMAHVTIDPRLWSTTQAAALQGDASKAKRELGWQATTTFGELIADMVDVDLRRIRTGVEESADYVR